MVSSSDIPLALRKRQQQNPRQVPGILKKYHRTTETLKQTTQQTNLQTKLDYSDKSMDGPVHTHMQRSLLLRKALTKVFSKYTAIL